MLKMKRLTKLFILLLLIIVLCGSSFSCVELVRDASGAIKNVRFSFKSGGQPPTINAFAASPDSINSGESSTLNWDVADATSVAIDPGAESVPASGSATASPTDTTTFALIATNSYGTVTQTVTVTVVGVPPVTTEEPSAPTESPTTTEEPSMTAESPTTSKPLLFLTPSLLQVISGPVINSFTAVPESIKSGESSMLSWDVSGATSLFIDHGVGPVPVSGNASISPSTTTTYTLTATNSYGSVTSKATVTVGGAATIFAPFLKTFSPTTVPKLIGSAPVINSFAADPTQINAGGSSTLSWNVTGATSVSIDHGVGTVPASGSAPVSPSVTTVYKLTATNSYGSTVASIMVTVSTAPPATGTAACEQALFDAVNQVRASFGKAPLTRNSYIDGVCRRHAQEWGAAYWQSSLEVAAEHAHDDFPARMNDIKTNAAIGPIYCWGENALASYPSCDAAAMAQAWYSSSHPPTSSECWPGHRENMLNGKITISGMGIYVDGNGRYWAIQIFTGPNPCPFPCQ
jgi:uncharacterized protein YkwD